MCIIRLTRQELYKQIWEEPIVKLAQRYGFSDTWLARICRKNKIPRPPRGYWARIQSGQRVPRTPLPKGDDSKIIAIITHDSDSIRANGLINKGRPSRKIWRSIIIPRKQEGPHLLIQKSAEIFEAVDQDDTGLVSPQQGCLNIHTSRECLGRALDFMDSIIKSLIANDFEVLLFGRMTRVCKDGISFSIAVFEDLDRRRRLRAIDHNLEGYYQFGYNMYEKKTYPSGRLIFCIDTLGFESQHKKIWRDTDTRNLEDNLKRIVSSLIRMTAAKSSLIQDKESLGRE